MVFQSIRSMNSKKSSIAFSFFSLEIHARNSGQWLPKGNKWKALTGKTKSNKQKPNTHKTNKSGKR